MTSINDPRRGYNAQTGKVEEFSLRRRPETSDADEWALWLEQHADYGIEFKAVQIAEALDSMHRGATNAALNRRSPDPIREELARALESAEPYVETLHSLLQTKSTRHSAWLIIRKIRAALSKHRTQGDE